MKTGWKQKLILAWGFGLVAGTFYANFFLEADYRQLLFQEKTMEQALESFSRWDEVFGYLCSRRLSLFFFLVLISLTVFGLLALYGSLFSIGFAMALLLSVITMHVGVKGLWYYILLWFPQALFYGPALWGTVCLCGRLQELVAGGEGRLGLSWKTVLVSHLGTVFLVLLLWILGIAAETWGNPWVLSLFFKKN